MKIMSPRRISIFLAFAADICQSAWQCITIIPFVFGNDKFKYDFTFKMHLEENKIHRLHHKISQVQ